MLKGIILRAHPTAKQKQVLSQWMGCARFIWNAKYDEDRYLQGFAKRYLPIGMYPPLDQTFSQYKNKELSPWLFDCPSQILRNSTYAWYRTYKNFLQGQCGKPKRKKKSDAASVHLTRELFCFEKCTDGVTRLFIGTKTKNIGYLSIKNHQTYREPKSIRIKRKSGIYTVTFCYEDGINEESLLNLQEHLNYLKTLSREDLEKITVGIDRGVKRPIQAGDEVFDFSFQQKRKKLSKEQYIKKCQKRLSKNRKGSARRNKRKRRLSKAYEKIANIRKDFCHKASKSIACDPRNKVVILEDLKTKQMTGKPAPQKDLVTGKWLSNRRRNKAGLNKSILDKNWCQFEVFLRYKLIRAGKALFKVSAHHTSQ